VGGIHGRTRAQRLLGLSDWDYIASVRLGTTTNLGNGRNRSEAQAVATRVQRGVVMASYRAGAYHSGSFSDALALWHNPGRQRSDKNVLAF